MLAEFREVCPRCRRPSAVCYCASIQPVASRTRVCFLQHPRERRVPIGTAWMAHLGLPNSELHRGVDFADNARVRELVAAPGTALLFPGPDAVDPATLVDSPPETLIVLDGTWSLAGSLLVRNGVLRGVRRIGFTPAAPSRYRIRQQPREDCVSTIEAVAYTLGALEGDAARFLPLLAPFDRMVETQLEYIARRPGPRRTRRKREHAPRVDATVAELRARPQDVVALYAESDGALHDPELLRLTAVRVATGEVFDAFVTPAKPIDAVHAAHLELDPARFTEPLASALDRFAAFLRPDDLHCGWGPYARALLQAHAGPLRVFADIRVPAARKLRRRPGGVEQALRLLGSPDLPPPLAPGRAGRRLAALLEVLRRL